MTTVGANVTAYSNTGLNASTQYTYRVRAYNVAGDSAYSNTSAATTQSGAPAAPTSLSAATVSSSQINLTWTDNNGNEDGTRIERSPDGVNFAQIASVGANITAYSNTGLAGGATYTYRVRAYNAGGDSPYSNTASATTLAGPPAAPTSLLLTSVSTTRIDLHWTDNSSNESNFMIERSTNGSTWMVIATLAPNVTTYSATGLNRNTRYYFRLRCWNAAGFSAYSNTANIKTKSR
ncbi:MAG: fibronectin type III domain-containing protein [Acidobacteria bacterium]|nr:fibronectin type III domain-containing protein [Acidobacteriota bacterium]